MEYFDTVDRHPHFPKSPVPSPHRVPPSPSQRQLSFELRPSLVVKIVPVSNGGLIGLFDVAVRNLAVGLLPSLVKLASVLKPDRFIADESLIHTQCNPSIPATHHLKPGYNRAQVEPFPKLPGIISPAQSVH
jgi:hypothetical protein